MDRLWSPWRLAYVTGTSSSTGCIFCDAESSTSPERESLVLVRGRLSYVILNLFPYNNGHLMVVPNRHVGSLAGSTAEELTELMRFTRDAVPRQHLAEFRRQGDIDDHRPRCCQSGECAVGL